jgi:cytochrome c oxidase cbb3-type subunit III
MRFAALFLFLPLALPAQQDPAVVAQGRDLYNRSCTMCHGAEGTVGDRGPALAAGRRYLRNSEEDLFDAIKNGIAGTLMPSTSLPADDVKKIVVYIRSLRATAIDQPVPGNVAGGEIVFNTKGRCRECHMVNGRGGLLGPDLSNIAAERSVRQIHEALTTPRPHVPARYQPVRVVLQSGGEIRGLMKNEHNFSYQVLDMKGKLHLLTSEEVKEVEYDTQSLMPTNWAQRLSAEELKDLVAFLSRQARPVEGAPREANARRRR